MNKNLFFIFVIIVNVNCSGVKSQTLKYDCRLFERDFEELVYVKNTSIESEFKLNYTGIEDGVFFITRFYGRDNLERAILFKKENGKSSFVDLLKNKETVLKKEDTQLFMAKLERVERGYFSQVCSEGPSEGSISLLLIKIDGVIIFKYEASQYDYTHLNNDEKGKIKNALALIDLLVGYVK